MAIELEGVAWYFLLQEKQQNLKVIGRDLVANSLSDGHIVTNFVEMSRKQNLA